jgi:hypothetical protein
VGLLRLTCIMQLWKNNHMGRKLKVCRSVQGGDWLKRGGRGVPALACVRYMKQGLLAGLHVKSGGICDIGQIYGCGVCVQR